MSYQNDLTMFQKASCDDRRAWLSRSSNTSSAESRSLRVEESLRQSALLSLLWSSSSSCTALRCVWTGVWILVCRNANQRVELVSAESRGVQLERSWYSHHSFFFLPLVSFCYCRRFQRWIHYLIKCEMLVCLSPAQAFGLVSPPEKQFTDH